MYADDCQVYLSSPASDAATVIDRLSACVADVNDWMTASRLPTTTEPIQDSGHVAGFKSAVGQDQHQRRLTIVSQRNGRQHVTLASSLTVNCRWTCMLLLSAGAVTTNWSSYIQSHGHCLYRQLRRPRIWVEGHPQLCSSDDHQLLIPQTWTVTFGARAFYTSGPTSWNALLAMLHHPALSLRCFGHFV